MNIRATSLSFAQGSSLPEQAKMSLIAQRRILRVLLILTDALALGLAFRLAFFLRFDLSLTVSPEVSPAPFFYPSLAAILVSVWILIFTVFNLYDIPRILGGVSEYSRIFNACTMGTMLVVLATFIMPEFIVSRFFVVGAWILSFLLVSSSRFFLRRVVYQLRQSGYFLVPTIVIGTNEEAVALARELSDWRSSGLRIIGFVETESEPNSKLDGLPILGPLEQIGAIIRRWSIEDLVVAITSLNRSKLFWLCEEVSFLEHVQLKLSSGLYELLATKVQVRTVGHVPLLSMRKVRLEPEEVYLKTFLEYSLALVGLVVLWPVMLALSILIKLDSRGPIFYRRRVLGVSGRPFDALKFRTMKVDGDKALQERPDLLEKLRRDHKLLEDPRVTRVGRWLRKYSLDELPQLFNVLMGQMSLVGPRMITAEEGGNYGRQRLNLLTVKPGITGLWQVSGRSDLSYEQRVKLDMYYIRNYSVFLDLQILFVQTIPAVIRGRGAY